MARVALVAPEHRVRETLVAVADLGTVELEEAPAAEESEAHRLLRQADVATASPVIPHDRPDVRALQAKGRWDELAGEAELEAHAASGVEHGSALVFTGWVPRPRLAQLTESLGALGTSVVELPRPHYISPPTLVRDAPLARSLRPLVQTYAVIPYEDVDPTLFAGISYAVMFGMMFGDAGHGILLALLGVIVARSDHPRLARFRGFWVFAVGAGVMSIVFGALYGEFFGPTEVLPVLWLAPLDDPISLIIAGVAVGAALLGVAYVFGIVNRWREGGPNLALYAATGIAGALTFFGAAVAFAGWNWSIPALEYAGGGAAGLGVAFTFVGFVAGGGSGAGAVAQAIIELFDTVIRLGANLVSFGRLAAFGLTHAAISGVVWDATSALWSPGLGAAYATAVFIIGNVLAFALESLVVGVQALRLEYYEIFSRVLTGEGRLFRPWHVPIAGASASRKESS